VGLQLAAWAPEVEYPYPLNIDMNKHHITPTLGKFRGTCLQSVR